MSELGAAATWLWEQLNTIDPAGGVHRNRAPRGAAHPLIVFAYQGGFDLTVLNGIRILTSGLFLIRAIHSENDNGSQSALEPIEQQIDDAVHRDRGDVNNGTVISCVREQPHEADYVEEGIRFYELGGTYRIQVQRQ